MKLRFKIPLLVAITMGFMGAMLYFSSTRIIEENYLAIEKDQMLKELSRITGAIDTEAESIQIFAQDYSGWDETYKFAEKQFPEYLIENFESTSFFGLKLNTIAIFDKDSKLIYGKGFDWQRKIDLPLPDNFVEVLQKQNFLHFNDIREHKIGIISFPNDLLLVVANPILTSNYQGPSHGTFIMARRLDPQVIKRLSGYAQLDITVADVDPKNCLQVFKDSYISDDCLKIVQRLNDNYIAGYVVVTDVERKPVMVLKIQLPRTIFKHTVEAFGLFIFSLIVNCIITVFLILFLLSFYILRPLTKLASDVVNVPKNRTDLDYLIIRGRDELSVLSRVLCEVFEKLTFSNQKIAADRSKLNFILQSIIDAVVVMDASKNIVMVNKSTELLTGYGKNELMGKPFLNKLKFFQEDNRMGAGDFISGLGKKNPMKSLQALSLVHKTGSKISVAESSAAVKDTQGKTLGYVVVLRDVTRERIVELEKMKNEFLTIASHQLRTPLTRIRWAVEMLLEGSVGELQAQQKKYINEIAENNDRMIFLINDFFDVAKIESDKISFLKKGRFSLAELVSEVVNEQRKLSPGRKIVISGSWPEKILIHGDKQKLFQAFANLFDNALKYSVDHSEIVVGIKKENTEAIVSVQNFGMGIQRSEQGRIFEKFFRAENAKKHVPTGTGLGLYVVQFIVKAHKGRVWFKSQVNKGATFYVALPLAGK